MNGLGITYWLMLTYSFSISVKRTIDICVDDLKQSELFGGPHG